MAAHLGRPRFARLSLMIAALLDVGCCMYWAFQYCGSIDAFFCFNGLQRPLLWPQGLLVVGVLVQDGRQLHDLPLVRVWVLGLVVNQRPVRSNRDQRVMMTMIAPPGIKRCNGPVWNHDHAVSNARRELAFTSCSE